MTTQDAAIARLEAQVSHLTENAKKMETTLDRMAAQLDAVQAKLDQSAGGFAVLRWFGFGSLASLIALGSMIYAWTHKGS
jgi:hypothetical protein